MSLPVCGAFGCWVSGRLGRVGLVVPGKVLGLLPKFGDCEPGNDPGKLFGKELLWEAGLVDPGVEPDNALGMFPGALSGDACPGEENGPVDSDGELFEPCELWRPSCTPGSDTSSSDCLPNTLKP